MKDILIVGWLNSANDIWAMQQTILILPRLRFLAKVSIIYAQTRGASLAKMVYKVLENFQKLLKIRRDFQNFLEIYTDYWDF